MTVSRTGTGGDEDGDENARRVATRRIVESIVVEKFNVIRGRGEIVDSLGFSKFPSKIQNSTMVKFIKREFKTTKINHTNWFQVKIPSSAL